MTSQLSAEHWAWLLGEWRIEQRRSADYLRAKRERQRRIEPPALPRFAMPSFDERRAA